MAVDPFQEHGQGRGGGAIHREDDIAFLQAGFGRTTVLGEAGHHDARDVGQAEVSGQAFVHGTDVDAEEGALYFPEFDEVPGHLGREVGRNGKGVARIAARPGGDGRVDADQPSLRVHEGAS